MRSPGGRELSLSACPGVGNGPPSKKKIANPRGCARGGMVTGTIEPCITNNPHAGMCGNKRDLNLGHIAERWLDAFITTPSMLPVPSVVLCDTKNSNELG